MIDGHTFKRAGAAGRPKTWVVLPEVHNALQALEQLDKVVDRLPRPRTGHKNSHLLFKRHLGVRNGDHALGAQINAWLNEFLRTANALCDEASARASDSDRAVIEANFRIAGLPDGRAWRLVTKQFRRTIAWYIATEPFGTVAGMRQFGHIREVTFLGYAGTKEAGFRDEIEEAEEIGLVRDLVEMYELHLAGQPLAGPHGRSLVAKFDEVTKQLAGKVVDDARFRKMLRNVAHRIYPGLLNDCFFDASKALCIKKRVGDEVADSPVFAHCDWEKCPNSCFWTKHRPALESALSDAVSYSSERRLSSNQKDALELVIAKLVRSIGALDAA